MEEKRKNEKRVAVANFNIVFADENDDVVYEMVEDDNELAALGKVFAELIDDADIEY